MKIFCKCITPSQSNFRLVICVAKDLISISLKAIIFSAYFFFAPSDSRFSNMSYLNKPYINGKLVYSAFRWCINSDDWFCGPGSHILVATRLQMITLLHSSNTNICFYRNIVSWVKKTLYLFKHQLFIYPCIANELQGFNWQFEDPVESQALLNAFHWFNICRHRVDQ